MRFKRVLLVFPGYKNSQYGALHPPAGLGYLAEVLRQEGIEYDVFDMRQNAKLGGLLKRLKRFQPDLLGVSLMTLLHKQHYALMDEVKKAFPHIKILAGGPHISTFREEALRQCPSIDFGIVREGEYALLSLCRGEDLAHIKGLLFRQDGQIRYSGDREFISDLDALPLPTYERFNLGRYITDEIPILTSRGCPYQCIYCPVKTAIGQRVRMKSPGRIADELEYWYKLGRRHFGIVDDNFAMNRERVVKLCDEIKVRRLTGLELRCPNGIRADHCDKDLLAKMKNAGFKYLAIGVEGGNNRILARLRKGESIEKITQVIKDACDLGFEIILFFILGSPGETWQDVEDSVRIASTYPVFDAKFHNLVPFPDTELFKWVKDNHFFKEEPEVYLNSASHWGHTPVFSTPDFTYQERLEALTYTARARKKIRIKAMERKLRKCGILTPLLARIFVLECIQTQLLHNWLLRRLGQAIFRKVAI